MVDENEGLLREVEEELRKERLNNLWQRYGSILLVGVVLLVAGVGGWKYWQNKQIVAAQTAGMTYQSAMTTLANGKTEDALKAFDDLAKGGQEGYQALAALQAAGAHLKQGKTSEARAAFDRVAADTTADTVLRDYATLQSVALNIGDADLSDVQNRLNRLLGQDSPWRANAHELVSLAAFHGKKYDVAKENLRAIVADPKAAQGTIQRANTLLASIAAMEVAKKGVGGVSDAKPAAVTPSEPAKSEPAKNDTDKAETGKVGPNSSVESNATPEKKE